MAKLNQIIAVEKGIKSRVYGEITEINKVIQKPDPFNGFDKEFSPVEEGGFVHPPERKRVQYIASEVLRQVARLSTELMEVTARKDWTNCVAKADVSLDGKVIIPGAPVSYLLFLEKQLTDMHTLVKNMPVLDIAEDWKLDTSSGQFKADPSKTIRTKKIAKPVVLVAPTVEHPGQAQMVAEDVVEGYWTTVKKSGAMATTDKKSLLERIEKLARAIKEAREQANGAEVVAAPDVGSAVFGFLLGD